MLPRYVGGAFRFQNGFDTAGKDANILDDQRDINIIRFERRRFVGGKKLAQEPNRLGLLALDPMHRIDLRSDHPFHLLPVALNLGGRRRNSGKRYLQNITGRAEKAKALLLGDYRVR